MGKARQEKIAKRKKRG